MLEGGLKCCCLSLKCFCLCSGASCWYPQKMHLPHHGHLLECSDQQRENSSHRCTVHRIQFLGRRRRCQLQHSRVCSTFWENPGTKRHTLHRSSLSHGSLQNDLCLCCLFPLGSCGHAGKASEGTCPWQCAHHLHCRRSQSPERRRRPHCSPPPKSTGSSYRSPRSPPALKTTTQFYCQADSAEINNQQHGGLYLYIHLLWEQAGNGRDRSPSPQKAAGGSPRPRRAPCWGCCECTRCEHRHRMRSRGQGRQQGPGDACLQSPGPQRRSVCSQQRAHLWGAPERHRKEKHV